MLEAGAEVARLKAWLEEAERGAPRMVLGPVADDACAVLEQAVEASRGLIVVAWLESCAAQDTLDAALEALGNAAVALWPMWYVGRNVGVGDTGRDACLMRSRSVPSVSERWLCAAWGSASKGGPYSPLSFAPAVQARQWALALDPERLVIALATDHPERDQLLGLVRAAEWLAAETGATTVLALPVGLADSPALDAAGYGTFVLAATSQPPMLTGLETPEAITPPAHIAAPGMPADFDPGTDAGERRSTTGGRRSRVSFGPIVGVPHPLSEGEQLLAKALADDEELARLFEHNAWVETARSSRFLVDLLWRRGRLAVEVDGFRFHAGRRAYSADRLRDYELLVSNYHVLRLPHEEVVANTGDMVERIRDVVRFIRERGEGRR